METRQLRYFVVLAEHLHFGHAADALFIAQPQLSNQISKLERELKVRLFDRSSRNVELSEHGKALLPIARRIINDVAFLGESARQLSEGMAGLLRIGFTFSALQWGLGDHLRTTHREQPAIAIEAEQLPVLTQVQLIRRHELDLGFVIGEVDTDGLVIRELTREPLLAVLPASHPQAEADAVDLAALHSDDFIGFPPSAVHDFITHACLTAGFIPHLHRQGPQVHTAIHMVAAGFGVTLAPTWDCRSPVDGAVFRPLTDTTLQLSLSAIHSDDTGASTLARAFIDRMFR